MEFLALLLGVAALAIASKASNRARFVSDELDSLRRAVKALEHGQPAEAARDDDRRATAAAVPVPQEAPPPQPEPVREPEPMILRVGRPAERTASEPLPVPAPQPEAESRRGINFEELFGRRLPVWGGSVALALAGFFLVKYSIDSGLLTPAVRCVLGLVFGALLIAAAEASRRIERFAIDVRIAQALSGAGVAVLYGTCYMATNLYGLVTPTAGFVGMAATTAAALGLSLRYGAPTALVGLLGGFATPALVNTGEGNVPALLAYLMLTIAGLLGVARQQGWRWLGALALAGGFGWSGILLLTDLAGFDVPGTGLFLILLALGGLLVMRGEPREGGDMFALGIPLVSGVMAFVQLALLVGKGGFGWLEWGLYALLSAGVTALAMREAAYRTLPLAALAIALVTFALWPNPGLQALAIVGGGLFAVFALPGLVFAVRRQDWLLWLIAAIVTPVLTFAVAYVRRVEAMSEISWGLVALALAIPAFVAAYAVQRRGADDDLRFPALVGGGAVLSVTGAALVVPPLQLPFAIFAVAAALAAVGRRTGRMGLPVLTAAASLAAAASYLDDAPGAFDAAGRAFGIVASTDAIGGLWRFVLPAAAVAGIAALQAGYRARLPYAFGTAALLALAAVQFAPLDWRAAALALLAALLLEAARRQDILPLRRPAIGVAALAGLWSAVPMLLIAGESLETLGGNHTNVSDLPQLAKVATWLLLPAVIAGFAAWREGGSRLAARLAWPAGVLAAGALFVIYKHVFAIEGDAAFAKSGFAERIVLTQALFALGFAAYRLAGLRQIARVLTLAALARFVWFDLAVFNPLVQAQDVGGWPLVNLLLPGYAPVPVWLWFAARAEAPLAPRFEMAAKLAGLAAAAAWLGLGVRQMYTGSVLTAGPVTSAENYSYSVAGLGFAIGLLLLGTARRDQLLRLVSLGVMLLTVGKVFLLDAAELGGLWRIASFLGLGICLIGISWYYTRRVFAGRAAAA